MLKTLPAGQAEVPEGAAADWTVPQRWGDYTALEHATWDKLFARQSALLERMLLGIIANPSSG